MIETWEKRLEPRRFLFLLGPNTDFANEDEEPTDNTWPELRESGTLTLDKLKNAGEAVIEAMGEGRDIHPRNKQTVANRLVRNALAKDYAISIPSLKPALQVDKFKQHKAILTFDHAGTGRYTPFRPLREATGLAICGRDGKFRLGQRQAGLVGKDKVEVRRGYRSRLPYAMHGPTTPFATFTAKPVR